MHDMICVRVTGRLTPENGAINEIVSPEKTHHFVGFAEWQNECSTLMNIKWCWLSANTGLGVVFVKMFTADIIYPQGNI